MKTDVKYILHYLKLSGPAIKSPRGTSSPAPTESLPLGVKPNSFIREIIRGVILSLKET